MAYQKERDAKNKELRKQKQEEQVKECTFKPQIEKKTQQRNIKQFLSDQQDYYHQTQHNQMRRQDEYMKEVCPPTKILKSSRAMA